jgi:diguanylate cyclase (GGDEF)-like protein
MKRALFSRLHTRLLFVILIAVAPAFGIIALNSFEQHAAALADARRQALELARSVAARERDAMALSRRLLESLAHAPELGGQVAAGACGGLLAELHKIYPYYVDMLVARSDGGVRCSANPLPHDVNVADRAYFRHAVQTRALAIGDYQVSRITGKPTVLVALPLLDDASQPRGIVALGLEFAWLRDHLDDLKLAGESIVTVVDNRGTVLARIPDDGIQVGKSIPNIEGILARAARDGQVTFESVWLDGVRRITAIIPIYGTAGGDMYVRVGIARDVALAAADAALYRSVTLMSLATLLTMALGWIASQHLVVRRVQDIAKAIKHLRIGDLQARTLIPPDRGELGELSRAFDGMADELLRRQQRIEHANGALVRAQRTLETLIDINRVLLSAEQEREMLETMCSLLAEVGGYCLVWVGYAEHDERKTLRPVATAGDAQSDLGRWELTWAETEAGKSAAGTAVRTGKVHLVRDVAMHLDPPPWRDDALNRGYRSVVSYPLRLGDGEILGALTMVAWEKDTFSNDELRLLGEAAADISFGIAVLRQRVARKLQDERITQLSTRDALTGLPNQRLLNERLTQIMSQAKPGELSVALLVLDLDRLKLINDSLGHAAGDALLVAVGERLLDTVREKDTVARLGDDDFAVLLVGLKGVQGATAAATKVFSAFSQPFCIEEHQLHVTVSLGIAAYPSDGAEASDLLNHARSAMNRAKCQGGNSFEFYAPEMTREATQRLTLEQALRLALERGEFELHYQPRIDLASGHVNSFEALLRWRHPELGMIPPNRFIPLAEETGLIVPIGEWVLTNACLQRKTWCYAGRAPLGVAVNLSVRQFWHGDVTGMTARVLRDTQTPADVLELEVTESVVMRDIEATEVALRELGALGVSVSIDDFGTGYSSLNYLRRLPIHKLKIDQSFVRDLTTDSDAAILVKAVIELARDLKLEVVAEGVERREELEFLAANGCEEVQGYLLGRPMPATDVPHWLRQWEEQAREQNMGGLIRSS